MMQATPQANSEFPKQAANVETETSQPAPEVKKLETIVIACNHSKASEYALHWTMEHIIRPNSQKIILLNIMNPPVEAGYYYTAGAAVYTTTYIEEIQKKNFAESSSLLCRYRKELQKKFPEGINCELIIGKGDARDEIVDFVESVHADMLIIGSRGLGALKRAFLGSVGDYCMRHAHIPVLIVKTPNEKK